MSMVEHDSGLLGAATEPSTSIRALRQWWTAITVALAAAVFTEAIFAGAILSGVGWARMAHSANALLLIVSAFAASLVALVTLRRVAHGLKLGLTLSMLGSAILLQAVVGKSAAGGANLLWVHVPLGVALVGFAMHAVARARKLGGE